MIGLIQNEIIKIFSKVASYVYAVIIIILLMLGALLYNSLYSFLEIDANVGIEFSDGSEEIRNVQGDNFTEKSDGPTGWGYMDTMAINFLSFITLFSVVIGSQSISSEFGDGTIKQLLIRPHRRWKILLSKYLTVNIYSIILIIVWFIASFLIGLIAFGVAGFHEETTISIGGLLSGDYVTTTHGEKFFKTLLFFLPGLIMVNTISFMLSTLFKNQALAVAVGIFVLFINSVLFDLYPLLMSRFEWFKFLPFPHLDMTVYTFTNTYNDISFTFSITTFLVYYIIFIVITFYYFQKRDITF